MLLFEKTGVVTSADDKTNIPFSFKVPEGVKALRIKYSYNPKEVENEAEAHRQIEDAMHKYGVTDFDTEKYMPVKNLITLSFDENGKYRGACHRQPNRQLVTIAEENSTPGIINKPIEAGDWDIVLNVHYAGCDVNYSIEIEGINV
ncbi:MAG: hypothetical protein IKF64_02740 [Eubacterium sp.]|nr:hypothetical protein [Eubacterium sp.]